MGKNNRHRRADKRRDRPRPHRAGQNHSRDVWLDEGDLMEILLFEAAEAAAHGNVDRREAVLQRVEVLGAGHPGRLAATAMSACLVSSLRSAWDGGWQPADIVRAAAKRLGRAHSDVAGQLIGFEARTSAGPGVSVPEPWAAQLHHLGAGTGVEPRWDDLGALRLGADLLGLLTHLPVLPNLLPPPSEWGRVRRSVRTPVSENVDSRMLSKVRALLAKAESTDFDEEAGALTAKAQELMARHAIDHAMLTGDGGEAPCGRRVGIDDPYAHGKASLLAAVARANRCRSVWMEDYGFSTIFGFSDDLDIVDVLYTSLLIQATRAMTAAGSVRDHAGRSRTRSFRGSFLAAFSQRIGARLRAATTVATEQAGVVHGGALLPVLAGRSAAVEDAFASAFPDLVQTGARVSNHAGWVAGAIAADLAHLGPEQQLLPGIAV